MMQLMRQSSQAQEPPPHISTGSDNGSGNANDSKLGVYVGDSPSDFAPLLRADLGNIVGHNKLLRQVAKAHGVNLKPLTAGQHAWGWGQGWVRVRVGIGVGFGVGVGVVHGSNHADNNNLLLCHNLVYCHVQL